MIVPQRCKRASTDLMTVPMQGSAIGFDVLCLGCIVRVEASVANDLSNMRSTKRGLQMAHRTRVSSQVGDRLRLITLV